MFIFSFINFLSSSVVKGEKFSFKYLCIDFIGFSVFNAAFKEIVPSLIKYISSRISPSYAKNSFFLETLGIKVFKTSAIKTELLFFLKNLKFVIVD